MAKGAKQRWNEKNYTPIKVSVRHYIASAFKSACIEKGESQASVLARAMIEYANAPPQNENEIAHGVNDENKYDTRRKRRKTIDDIIKQLNQVLEAEEEYRDSIPYNFVNRAGAAAETIELLTEVIDNLNETYQIT